MGAFVIHALPVGAGILAIAPLPGRSGDYAADLAHLKDWRPSLVLTLTTPGEMAEAGVPELGHDIGAMGSRWAHLPVADLAAPDAAQHGSWREASRAALAALAGGGRVLIHCLGGCGRSGMAALRLMIEAGEAPDAALARLRAIRPCAVETQAQARWAGAVDWSAPEGG
ncbi:protein phosphatase [Roseovarius spongiae]|uniref:Protein phosphatase n=1 Tax=Roseovarius spongiae TaxID=2320272 RepID=A0A3A8AV27_9RHOB|nr:protein phosphatase [Roseovarius spongiae]RKF14003.1 protein phosphatase [Roseovarius spongiae]